MKKQLLLALVIVVTLLSACRTYDRETVVESSAAPSVVTEATSETEAVTVPVETAAPVPETEPVPTETVSSFKVYKIAVANKKKNIYDKPGGKNISDFETIGYFNIVEEVKDSDGVLWGRLEDNRGWTKVKKDLFPKLDMLFCSGAGAWGTTLSLKTSGSFSGSFSDSDMGDCEDEYPNGTCYVCDFTGSFKITDIDDYKVTLKLTSLKLKKKAGKTWIDDGIRYISEDAFGLSGGKTFVLYFPDTPVEELPKDMDEWGYDIPESGKLKCYALYCKKLGTVFFSE